MFFSIIFLQFLFLFSSIFFIISFRLKMGEKNQKDREETFSYVTREKEKLDQVLNVCEGEERGRKNWCLTFFFFFFRTMLEMLTIFNHLLSRCKKREGGTKC